MPTNRSDSPDKYTRYLEKMIKLQQDKESALQQEISLLRSTISQTNTLLDKLVNVSGSGSTIAATKKTIPFQTGNIEVGQLLTLPDNPDLYPSQIDVYKINNNRVIPHMTLVSNGTGDILFISAYGKNSFNTEEEVLHVNDQRELFNVYELRLRSTLPLTTVRLIEGFLHTGATGVNTQNNIVVRPTIQEIRLF